MSKFKRFSFYALSCLLFLASCQKKELDPYYARPDNLADPIYQQLQARGNFTNILACIDKAGYKDILGQAGYWTFFAPTDDAFTKFLQEKGLSGVDKVDATLARQIVTYSLVINSYRKDQLTSNQTAAGPVPNSAYRRRTAYYDFVYTENGKSVVANNRNGTAYVPNDNNNKSIPYFLSGFMTTNALTAADYTAFYPTTAFTSFNVGDAKVTEADIPAENGTIHIVDKVLLPPPNIDQYIASNPNYSEFKKLLDKVAIYVSNPDLTHRYNVLTGKTDSVFLKFYNGGLGFSPNNEGYTGLTQTDAQTQAWAIAVPTNTELLAYEKKILRYFGTFEAAPPQVLIDLINAHMFRNNVWPQRVALEANIQSEPGTYSATNIVEKKMLSNGMFYGINAVQDANVFRTVYGNPYLDPKYSLMLRMIDATDLRVSMKIPSQRYTLFMLSNADLIAARYNYYTDRVAWGYQAVVGGTIDYSTTASDRVSRLVQSTLLYTPNGEFDNLAGEGVAEAFNGEYIKYKAGKLYAAGNVFNNTEVTVDSSKIAHNQSKVYYTKGVLQFAENTVTLGASIEKLGNVAISDPNYAYYNSYYRYLINSSLWVAASKDITGVASGSFYTVFIPTNAAIVNGVKAGILPGDVITGAPNFTPTTQADKDKVANFINLSIINKFTVAADGKKTGAFPTLAKDANGDSRTVNIVYPAGNPPAQMEVRDRFYNATTNPGATINYSQSNQLANRTLIHSVNKVLNPN